MYSNLFYLLCVYFYQNKIFGVCTRVVYLKFGHSAQTSDRYMSYKSPNFFTRKMIFQQLLKWTVSYEIVSAFKRRFNFFRSMPAVSTNSTYFQNSEVRACVLSQAIACVRGWAMCPKLGHVSKSQAMCPRLGHVSEVRP